jgi:hypothetical protein
MESSGIIGRRDSVDFITNRYGLDGPGIEFRFGAKFSVRIRKCPETHPGLLCKGYRIFPGDKRTECGADHVIPSSVRL